jgi:hypothetical protein
MYLMIKHIHVTCVLLSIAGFALRGWWMLVDHRLLRHRLTRSVPHVVDTVLLGTAITHRCPEARTNAHGARGCFCFRGTGFQLDRVSRAQQESGWLACRVCLSATRPLFSARRAGVE